MSYVDLTLYYTSTNKQIAHGDASTVSFPTCVELAIEFNDNGDNDSKCLALLQFFIKYFIKLLDPENIGIAVGILALSHLQAEI
jgi:hypothetical protein